jgi:hypothetical protein
MLLRQHLNSKDEENLLLEVGSKYGVSICKRKQMRVRNFGLDLFANLRDQAKKWERNLIYSQENIHSKTFINGPQNTP